MAYTMNEILPHLYIGNIVNSMDMRHLNELNIRHIISVYEKSRMRFSQREYLLLKVCDKNTENLAAHFSIANEFIHKARLSSSSVLVHCIKGVSRSPAIVTAYIMSITNLGWHDALKVVQAGRPMANPNKGFIRQLRDFEKNGCDIERARLKASFDSDELSISDEKTCALALEKWHLHMKNVTEGQSTSVKNSDVAVMYEINTAENVEKNISKD